MGLGEFRLCLLGHLAQRPGLTTSVQRTVMEMDKQRIDDKAQREPESIL